MSSRELVMPRTLTNVRHGESESNLGKRLAEKGNPHPREADMMKAHTSRRRLTPLGVRQAIKAGEWLWQYFQEDAVRRGEVPFENVRGYVSPYARAMETAGRTNLPIQWLADARLAERNWGDMDQLTHEERVARYGETSLREEHGIFWPAGNGETLHALSTRLWQHFDMLCRKHSDHDVVEVDHGETEMTKRFMLERWLPEDVVHMLIATDTDLAREVLGKPTDYQNKIINCRIIQYTREHDDGSLDNKYVRVRLIDPSHPDDPARNLPWQPIVRRKFSSADLLKYVEQFPHYLEAA